MSTKEEPALHVERALFVIGKAKKGKTTQLRNIFRDRRMHKGGKALPKGGGKIPPVALSNERWLYVRLSSPQESSVPKGGKKVPESLDDFIAKCRENMKVQLGGARRWNFAGALWPRGRRNGYGAEETIKRFISEFWPERVRAVVLHTDLQGHSLADPRFWATVDGLRAIPEIEVMLVDAREYEANGLACADFFDFT